jgi:hypothetical protein
MQMDSSLDAEIAGNSEEILTLIFPPKSGFYCSLLHCVAATSFAIRTNFGCAARFKEGFEQ